MARLQRFMELDQAIKLHAQENHNTEGGADSNDCPAESYPESLDYIHRVGKPCLVAEGEEHGTGLSFAGLIIGLEDLPIRRL
jgi:hypothetical protein